jgi:squalene synthase HpnC
MRLMATTASSATVASRGSVDNADVSVDHYENFPVASILCPPRLRPAVRAIYAFARTADDLADEGDATPQARLSDLAQYRRDLQAVVGRAPTSKRWPAVFNALRTAIEEHDLPVSLLADLLSAFEQDVVKQSYVDRAELLDYCRRSANPVGRLLLHLYGHVDAASLARSDAVCTALQLINFWQDLSVDTRRGRLYVPLADCDRRAVAADELLMQRDSMKVRALMADMVAWAHDLMRQGAPLALQLPGRAGWELRMVVQGGLCILEKIARNHHECLAHRPVVRIADSPLMLWRAFTMRAQRHATKPTVA